MGGMRERKNGWNERKTEWVEWEKDRMGVMRERQNGWRKNELKKEWVEERMCEWKNGWKKECMNERMGGMREITGEIYREREYMNKGVREIMG